MSELLDSLRSNSGITEENDELAKTRVHELASELGADSRELLALLKEMGEFVKSPSSTMEPPVVRKVRAEWARRHPERAEPREWHPASPAAPASAHPMAVAAATRRAVMQRSERDWSRFQFSEREKARWLRAGVPVNKAHIAAILRDGERRGAGAYRLTEQTARTRVGDKTVLDLLLEGSNALRVEERLSRLIADGAVRGVNADLLRLTTSQKPGPEGDLDSLTAEYSQHPWRPVSVPDIAKAAAALAGVAMVRVETERSLREQIARYRGPEREVGPLLSAWARTYGVFHAGPVLTQLVGGVVGDEEPYKQAIACLELIQRAARGSRFYFLGSASVDLVDGSGHSGERRDALPPSPSGFALLDGEAPSILAWDTASDGQVWQVLVPRALLVKRIDPLTMAEHGCAPAIFTQGTGGAGGAAYLAAMCANRSKQLGGRHRRTADSPLAGGFERESDAAGLRPVVVSYVTAVDADTHAAQERREASHRWAVTGHWRRQWYASAQEHQVIWIDEHTAGPAGKPLLRPERVEVHR